MARRSRSLSQRSLSRHGIRNRSALLRPPPKTLREQARDFIWDKQKKTCLTRTPMNWCAVAIYYSIFLGIVFLIFAVSLKITEMATDLDYGPQYILDDSPIGPSPALNFFPLNGSENLIWLSKNRSYSDYVNLINKEFDKYKRVNGTFDTSQFGECANAPYGYDEKKPCLFFRLNRLILWEPIPYHMGDRLPHDMPEEVRKLVLSNEVPRVWMSCEGTLAKDRDHILRSSFTIQGKGGFSIMGYPFERQSNYVDPIIAVKFTDADLPALMLGFTCTPWSKKMDPEKTNVEVVLYFE